jgi:cardiolipin synthase A/B
MLIPDRQIKQLQLLTSGKPYFESLLAAIDQAEREIHLQFYIFSHDTIGKRVLEKLENACERGVRVYILLDAFGSYGFPSRIKERLISKGAYFRFFEPFLLSASWSFGRRLHHKVLVVDRKLALVGGINIADRYYGPAGTTPWLDFAVSLSGPTCAALAELCRQLWKKKRWITKSLKNISRGPVRIRRNDWLRGQSEITLSYVRAIRSAERSITVVGAYFLPRRKIRKLLTGAAKRGVKVRIVVSKISDVPFIHNVSYSLYNQLGKQGIEIYEWTPSVMHGKCMVVDNRLITVGSYNHNRLSDFRSLELNIEMEDESLCSDFNEILREKVFPQCLRFVPDPLRFGLWARIKLAISRFLLRIIFFLFMSPLREKKPNKSRRR